MRPVLPAVVVFALYSCTSAELVTADESLPSGLDAANLNMTSINQASADAFAELALAGVVREFPNKPSEVQADATWARTPRVMHPTFYGSFDWHSAVHGHWMLVRLLRLDLLGSEVAVRTRELLTAGLNETTMAGELLYFEAAHNKSFERMYGWAWYLRLCAELEEWGGDSEVEGWRQALRPLEDLLVARIVDYLPKLTWPVRAGVHRNTAFALTHVFDYAVITGNEELRSLIISRAREWFLDDRDWGWRFEPSGQDFLSSGLEQVDLMRRVLAPEEFLLWLEKFGLPELVPAIVSDQSDGHLVHLAGLNLSRAWCLEALLEMLPSSDQRVLGLADSAQAHRQLGLSYVNSGNYEGDHWLASFAVYMASGSGR